MRRLVLFFLLSATYGVGHTQVSVVSAPIMESTLSATNATLTTQVSIQSTMSSVIASMEKSEKEYKEAMTKATWVRNLQSAQRLLTLIENLVCTSKDLNVKLSFARSNCLYSFQYEMMIIKVQMAADYIGILMSTVSMTVAERAQMFKATTEAFEQSQNMMIEMQNSLDADIARSKQLQSVTREVGDFMNFDRSKKRK